MVFPARHATEDRQRLMRNPLLVFIVALMVFVQTPKQGASTSVYLANSSEMEGLTGGYYEDSRKANPSARATDTELSFKLWAVSEELTNTTDILEPLQLSARASQGVSMISHRLTNFSS